MAPRGTGTRPQDFSISELLEWIHAGELVLPEFQRDYDWDDDRVVALVATIMRGWPAGSLLLQELAGSTFFLLRPFEGGPSLSPDSAQTVVLDGQQRLTALYHAVYDTGPSVYAIRANYVTADAGIDDLEEAMRSFDREDWNRSHRSGPFTPDDDWIPLYALRSPSDYFAWRDDAASRSDNPELVALAVTDAYRNGLERFEHYRLPAVIVQGGLEPAAIARIFERVNRQGLVLRTFDLMVARTFEQNWNLRDRWSSARLEFPVLDDFFADDGMPVIRAIALATLNNVREQAVLNLEPANVRLQWDDAVEATARAVTFLRESCGLSDPTWTPYGGMVITLAAIEREHRLVDHEDVAVRWFLSRSLGLRYESAANTVTVDEYRHLHKVLLGQDHLNAIPVSERVLQQATRKRQGAVWRAFLCCLSMAGATDVGLSGVAGDDLALTPTPLLEKATAPKGLEAPHQLVLNLVLAHRTDARQIGSQGLGGLVTHLSQLAPSAAEEVRRSQLLPPSLTADTPTDQFIKARTDTLSKWLAPRLGYHLEPATDITPLD
jgi:hypothetical protein